MAHTGIFATSSECTIAAGYGYSSTLCTEAVINALCLQAESIINAQCKYNFSDAYSGLNADVKGLLSAAESAYVGNCIIKTDMRGIGRAEAQTRMDWNDEVFKKTLELLGGKVVQDFMNNA